MRPFLPAAIKNILYSQALCVLYEGSYHESKAGSRVLVLRFNLSCTCPTIESRRVDHTYPIAIRTQSKNRDVFAEASTRCHPKADPILLRSSNIKLSRTALLSSSPRLLEPKKDGSKETWSGWSLGLSIGDPFCCFWCFRKFWVRPFNKDP